MHGDTDTPFLSFPPVFSPLAFAHLHGLRFLSTLFYQQLSSTWVHTSSGVCVNEQNILPPRGACCELRLQYAPRRPFHQWIGLPTRVMGFTSLRLLATVAHAAHGYILCWAAEDKGELAVIDADIAQVIQHSPVFDLRCPHVNITTCACALSRCYAS
ncbi:hypothetical protein GGX14DRAFT_448968 [Mycena pura]|uniref:Uncharacterized protein n=1 Tax=Mycena pura TaxID=153505 RepID=A0AAD6VG25_9AGAR|nr:hypothetical protein GGX14DRAFT_476482 [Mycena pura]KAJ7211652.1 hypothetical protein GGX14DRAFT_448968 [Mycena pura]